MVTIHTTCKRLPADTVNGEIFVLTTTYSSQDKAAIDWIEEQYKSSIGDGIITTYEGTKEAGNEQ